MSGKRGEVVCWPVQSDCKQTFNFNCSMRCSSNRWHFNTIFYAERSIQNKKAAGVDLLHFVSRNFSNREVILLIDGVDAGSVVVASGVDEL